MKVTTGSAKGATLKTLGGLEVRPTSDRVKQAAFNAVQFETEGRRVLDLFAGSGQLGIEALSRGAKSAVFVDSDPNAIRVIADNLAKTGLASSAALVRSDALSFLDSTDEAFDMVFMDPPYGTGLLEAALGGTGRLLSRGGLVVCERPRSLELKNEINGLVKRKDYNHGKTAITVYRKE